MNPFVFLLWFLFPDYNKLKGFQKHLPNSSGSSAISSSIGVFSAIVNLYDSRILISPLTSVFRLSFYHYKYYLNHIGRFAEK